MKTLITLLVVFAVIFFIRKKLMAAKHDKKVIEEQEKHIVLPKTKQEITNDYFLLCMDNYLNKIYEDMISWEILSGGPLYYRNLINEVRIDFINQKPKVIHVRREDVWFAKKGETAKPEPENIDEVEIISTNDIAQDVTEYLVKNSDEIQKIITNAMNSGNGFFAYYEVDKEVSTTEFMETLKEKLEENGGYDVSFKENILEIGFQNLI